MVSGVAQSAIKAVGGARFSLVNVMPATFLVGFWAVSAAAGLYTGNPHDPGQIAKNLASPGWAIIAIFGIFVLAVLLRPFQAALVQFLEGYWPNWPGVRQVADLAVERHRRILHTARVIHESKPPEPAGRALQDVAGRQRRLRRLAPARARAAATVFNYPQHRPPEYEASDHRIMPTLLGNVLRDGEDTAGDRYGLRFEVVAYRLWPTLSKKLDAENSRNLDLLDTSAALCVSLALAAVSSVPFIGNGGFWFLVPITAAILSAVAYRGAILVAKEQGQLQATAVDLHRFDMLTALHCKLPETPDEEQAFNIALSDFLQNRESLVDHPLSNGLTYRHPDPVAAQEAPGGSEAGKDEPGT
jgi:hypothetical protein